MCTKMYIYKHKRHKQIRLTATKKDQHRSAVAVVIAPHLTRELAASKPLTDFHNFEPLNGYELKNILYCIFNSTNNSDLAQHELRRC